MTEDTTIRPDVTQRGMQPMMAEPLEQEPMMGASPTIGSTLQVAVCPNCGNEIDADADYCEVCHRYVRTDVCSFCGSQMAADEMFCHECGNPRGGIVCPMCNTLNDFSFCKQCGTPLTDEAKMLVENMRQMPDYQLLMQTARELEKLDMEQPFTSEKDIVRSQENIKLRKRVLMLLAKDKGVVNPVVPPVETKKRSVEELRLLKDEKTRLLTNLLERMAVPAIPSPIKARNYAMAQKPMGVRLAWVCNWKHALHSSPCGCGKPQLGGKWVIMGTKTKANDENDDI